MTRGKKLVIGVALAVLVTAGGGVYYFQQVSLPHFHTIREGVLYRSGQPRGVGLAWVKRKGVRTLINLRRPESDGTPEEIEFAEENGMQYYNIRIGTSREEIRESIDQFLEVVDDEDNWPILVHCSRGKERSGVMSAIFRIEYDRWSNEDALSETVRLGLDPEGMPIPVEFIKHYRPRGSTPVPEEIPAHRAPEAPWQE